MSNSYSCLIFLFNYSCWQNTRRPAKTACFIMSYFYFDLCWYFIFTAIGFYNFSLFILDITFKPCLGYISVWNAEKYVIAGTDVVISNQILALWDVENNYLKTIIIVFPSCIVFVITKGNLFFVCRTFLSYRLFLLSMSIQSWRTSQNRFEKELPRFNILRFCSSFCTYTVIPDDRK